MSGDNARDLIWYVSMVSVALLLPARALIAQKRLAVEQGQTPLFKQTNGGNVGGIRYYGPFIRLSLYEDFLVIRCWHTIVLHYDEIDWVAVSRWLELTTGVRIVHHGHAPSYIYLGSMDAILIQQLIEQHLPVNSPARRKSTIPRREKRKQRKKTKVKTFKKLDW